MPSEVLYRSGQMGTKLNVVNFKNSVTLSYKLVYKRLYNADSI